MENNPKKSKALIITLVVVLLLAGLGYYFYSKSSNNSSSVNGSTSSGNIFTSLFNPSNKKADVKVIKPNTTDTNTDSGQSGTSTNSPNGTGIGTDVSNSGFGSTGTLGSNGNITGNGGPYKPTLNSLPNNITGANIPGINPIGTLTGSTTTTPTSTPTVSGTTTPPAPLNICAAVTPLEFTQAEKDQIKELLKQYYLLAPGLATTDDLATLDTDLTNSQSLISKTQALINLCYDQKSSLTYTGPQEVKSNPYYTGTNDSPAYVPGFGSSNTITSGGGLFGGIIGIPLEAIEKVFNIW
jgi:hypothetical protein